MFVTTSWDDGYLSDLRISELLQRHGLTGTFYPCPKPQHQARMLDIPGIRTLDRLHEVGAHSLTHPRLTQVGHDSAKQEVVGSKEWIESITGRDCRMFCYPKGDWNAEVEGHVKAAGFAGARLTTETDTNDADPFRMMTTIQVFPFPVRRQFRTLRHWIDPLGPLRVRLGRLRRAQVPFRCLTSWSQMTMALFDRSLAGNRQCFHLWGHSEELDRYGMWEELERVFSYIAAHQERITPCTNGALVEHLKHPSGSEPLALP